MNKIDLINLLEEACGDRCNAEYNPCDYKEAARELRDMKPVVYQMRMKADWVENWQEWVNCTENVANDYINTPRLNDWSFEVRKLYALGESNEP